MFQVNLLVHVNFKFTAMLKRDAINMYGEMGQKLPAFLSSEIEDSK